MPLVKVVLSRRSPTTTTGQQQPQSDDGGMGKHQIKFIIYTDDHCFEEFEKQFPHAFPELRSAAATINSSPPPANYTMYWVDNRDENIRFRIKTGHYFNRYVRQQIDTHHLLIEYTPPEQMAATRQKQSIRVSAWQRLGAAISNFVPANVRGILRVVKSISDNKWREFARYYAAVQSDNRNVVQHKGVQCRGCYAEIVGVRFLCIECADEYSLCTVCSVMREMHNQHIMLRLCDTAERINGRLQTNLAIDANGFLETVRQSFVRLCQANRNGGIVDVLACVGQYFAKYKRSPTNVVEPIGPADLDEISAGVEQTSLTTAASDDDCFGKMEKMLATMVASTASTSDSDDDEDDDSGASTSSSVDGQMDREIFPKRKRAKIMHNECTVVVAAAGPTSVASSSTTSDSTDGEGAKNEKQPATAARKNLRQSIEVLQHLLRRDHSQQISVSHPNIMQRKFFLKKFKYTYCNKHYYLLTVILIIQNS